MTSPDHPTPQGPSLQERYAPKAICFGCGPANAQGLRIRSFRAPGPDEVYLCTFRPEPHHQAFPGVLNGGIIGALLDCHSNWAAAMHLMERSGAAEPPCCVTSDFHVKLRRPTPVDRDLYLRARIEAPEEGGDPAPDRVVVVAELEAAGLGKICATCRGTFVAVKPDHPAYHRW